MCWYTKKNRIRKVNIAAVGLLSLTAATILSCQTSSSESKNQTVREFDLPSFFQQEVKYLNSSKPKITKTVLKDSVSETKEVIIADWNKELSSFLSVDLNKPAYRGTYIKDSVNNTVTYTFKDSTIDLSLVTIVYNDQIPTILTIKKSTKNLLYNTEENLKYIRRKSYNVIKDQSVRILGNQHYNIEGVIE